MVVLRLSLASIDSNLGFYTPDAAGVRLVTGVGSELGEGLNLISVTPDTDTGPSLLSVPVPPTIPKVLGSPMLTTGATASYIDPFVSSGTVKAGVQNGAVDVVDVQPVQPVQRAPTPAGPITTGATPSAPAPPEGGVQTVAAAPSLNVGRFVFLGPGGAALEEALSVDTARLKPTTTFLSGATVHVLSRDVGGTTSLFRNATTTPPSPSGNVEWYPLTEVIHTYDYPGAEWNYTLVFQNPGASDASDASYRAILAKLGEAAYSYVVDNLGNDFGLRSMSSVVYSNTEWFCKKGPNTVVRSAPAGSALVSTHPRVYMEPSDSCRVFAPDPVVSPVVATVTTVTTVTAAPPTPLSQTALDSMKQSSVQPVQPAPPAGGVHPAAPPAVPPTQIPAAVSAVIAASPQQQQPMQQPAQVQPQPASQPQPATQQQPAQSVQPDTQLTVTATPQASSLGCTEFEGCLARASGGDFLACGNALRASGCAGAAGATGAAGAASVYQYSSGTGPLVPLRKLTSGALYGSDAERAYTVVPDTASPSRGKVLVSSLSSPSSVSSADSLDSVYPCALSGAVWAVAPVFPAEPQDAQVQYTRTDTTPPPATTKAPDLTVLWIVLGALGFALCLVALYAASRPRGLAASRGPGAVVL